MTSVPTHNNPSDTLLIVDEFLRDKTRDTCRKYKRINPNLSPYINSLSKYSAQFNSYIQIYVYGENFFPRGLTTVDFGNIQNIPIKYLGSKSFYFELQIVAFPGVYDIVVKNNLHLSVRNTTANSVNGLSSQSNAVQFTITSQADDTSQDSKKLFPKNIFKICCL
jgi:hypothetical protein